MPIDLLNFVRKWNASTLTERSAAPQHFRDLCEVLDVPHPTQSDEVGASYTYEKRVSKAGTGEQGFADVWKRGWFAWEYKSKGGDLKRAYKQLNEYHESLENPPLLIVCDFTRFEVHTKFENAPPRVFAFTLDDLLVPSDTATCALPPVDVLRHVFGDFNKLRPEVVAIPVTRAAAEDFLRLATRLELERALTPNRPSKEEIAHFLMRLVFCLFADSVELLPDSTFRRLVRNHRHSPISFNRALPQLFQAMSHENSFFGPANIPYFNGGLFKDDATIPLDHADLGILASAAHHDWSHIEPAIFGTLFERSLDSAKRSMIGAHYTSPEDILLLIEPVVMTPLRRRWDTVRQAALEALAAEPPLNKDGQLHASLRANRPALTLLQVWAAELSQVRILDPACGSGNFLYIALKKLLDLWQEARVFAIHHGLALAPEPIPSPTQLYGIEIDFYAHEIASIVVWIGFLQWKRDHGEKFEREPLLEPLDNIQHADAILRYNDQNQPYEPEWPEAEYIIGNPPFLTGSKLRRELGDSRVQDLFALYKNRVSGAADLVCYWLEKGRAALEARHVKRVGFIATQGVRGGASQKVLSRITASASIFMAWSDRNWELDGATVHVAFLAFDGGSEQQKVLDGHPALSINADLTDQVDTTDTPTLSENEGLWAYGSQTKGSFDISNEVARKLLDSPNPFGKDYRQVVRHGFNGKQLLDRKKRWVIDFGLDMSQSDAAFYEAPFEYVKAVLKPERQNRREARQKLLWWLHARPSPKYRAILASQHRYIATPATSKYRVFVWLTPEVLVDHAIIVFAREDDYFLGVLQSLVHETWSRRKGTQVREAESGGRYTPLSTFMTFPFPWPPGTEPSEADSPIVRAIAEAARTLVHLRDAWLNPPDTPGHPISPDELKKRTLTNLYNARPTWLDNAHRTLNEAVFAAYGWPLEAGGQPLTTQQILANLLALNHHRAALVTPDEKRKAKQKTRRP